MQHSGAVFIGCAFLLRSASRCALARIVTKELARLHWTPNELLARQRSDPAKLALAARSRQQTTVSIKEIAERLHLGKPKGAKTNLHKFMNNPQTGGPQIQLVIG